MQITGTSKISNLLEIPSIKQQIKRNQSISIKDDCFWNHDIQIAVKMGYLKTDSSESESINPESLTRKTEFKNISNRPVTISGVLVNHGKIFTESPSISSEYSKKKNKNITVSITVLPNSSVFIEESDLNNEDLILATKAGILQQVESNNVSNAPSLVEDNEDNEDTTHDLLSNDGLSENKKLDFNDEIVIKKTKNSDPSDPRKFTVIVDPNKNEEKNEIEGAITVNKSGEIDFVSDVKKHPKLDQSQDNNKEIDFVS